MDPTFKAHCDRQQRVKRLWVLLMSLSAFGLLGTSAGAAQSDPGHSGGTAGSHGSAGGAHGSARGVTGAVRGQVFDNRYQHGYYYPPRGAAVRSLPSGYRPFFFRGRPYYFYGGVWYAPGPLGFVVVSAPVGLFLTVLPPYYTTVWFGGVPYYYADDTYYEWEPDMNGYVVVTPPADTQPGTPPAAPALGGGDLYIYPKNGQSATQQAADRYECHTWAKNQTDFDPSQPGAGTASGQLAIKTAQYNRAMTACLEARGYSVD
ncbi:MAG TPA: DUF6515 family protein [Steroidobacteraceae bacterium]|nr:DUF6515 family protein [Steroidobacteraceae bacterium]